METDGTRKQYSDREAKKRERIWKTLVEQILKGNVIPVIGSEMAKIQNESSTSYLVNLLAEEEFGIDEHFSSFTSLLSHKNCNPSESIYMLTNMQIEDHPKLFEPTELLRSFLSIKYFPFVITTTIDPLVENTMREIHGDSLRVLRFCNDPQANEDIRNSYDLTTPTLYYMFGKANDSDGSFVLTDTDLLRFSKSWLMPTDSGNKSKPFNLSNALSNKYLLVLGNNFQDWLFRFFWFAMKDEKLAVKSNIPIGMEALEHSDNQLIEFLNFSNITAQVAELPDFVGELKERLSANEHDSSEENYFSRPKMNADVFISYSRADKDVAMRLYHVLQESGLNVWFDRDSLGVGVDFRNEIRSAIRTCKLFVPVLSHNITSQAAEEHVYRMEWIWAVEHKRMISSAIDYIVPFAEDGFNIEDRTADIPEDIYCHNAFLFNRGNGLENNLKEFARKLHEVIKQ